MYMLNTMGLTVNICNGSKEGYRFLPKNDGSGKN